MNITISKNRGWRGLANAVITDDKTGSVIVNSMFSFSAPMWQDLLKGYLVTYDISTNIYTVWRFNNTERLPKPHQQRSVLIKGFAAEIIEQTSYPSGNIYNPDTPFEHRILIQNYIKNKNNHTTSSHNMVGLRVIPNI